MIGNEVVLSLIMRMAAQRYGRFVLFAGTSREGRRNRFFRYRTGDRARLAVALVGFVCVESCSGRATAQHRDGFVLVGVGLREDSAGLRPRRNVWGVRLGRSSLVSSTSTGGGARRCARMCVCLAPGTGGSPGEDPDLVLQPVYGLASGFTLWGETIE
jgi:hypothetical protein